VDTLDISIANSYLVPPNAKGAAVAALRAFQQDIMGMMKKVPNRVKFAFTGIPDSNNSMQNARLNVWKTAAAIWDNISPISSNYVSYGKKRPDLYPFLFT
jgi:hypothetical protein